MKQTLTLTLTRHLLHMTARRPRPRQPGWNSTDPSPESSSTSKFTDMKPDENPAIANVPRA